MCENTVWAIFLVAVAIAILGGLGIQAHRSNAELRMYLEAGYERVLVTHTSTSTSTEWQKRPAQ